MTVDLNIDPVYIIDRIRWKLPFRDIINEIIKEYKSARNLRPVKIVVLGPPASGKTRVARYLADHYGIQYIHVKTLISITMDKTVVSMYFAVNVYEQLTFRPAYPAHTVAHFLFVSKFISDRWFILSNQLR